jgi:hypothetical protein
MGKYIWPEPTSVYSIDSFEGQLDYLYEWLTIRFSFILEEYGIQNIAPEPDAFKGTFNVDDGIKKIIIYETSDYDGKSEETLIGYSRDSSTGEYLKDGNGQLNFTVVINDGFVLDSIEVNGSYKNLKTPPDTLKDETYRITKINSDLQIMVTTKCVV